jgi:ComF family protein
MPREPGNRWLCRSCLDNLERNLRERDPCPRCGLNRSRRTCTCDLVWDHAFERVVSLFDFDDTVRGLAHQIKYRGRSRLAYDIGLTYGRSIHSGFFDGVDGLLPVPLHRMRRLRRGYNQAEAFARGVVAGRPERLRNLDGVLVRKKNTKTQTALDRETRQKNLSGAFAVRADRAAAIAGARVVLVDDVVTTGATTGECTRELLEAGARSVRVLSMARD